MVTDSPDNLGIWHETIKPASGISKGPDRIFIHGKKIQTKFPDITGKVGTERTGNVTEDSQEKADPELMSAFEF